MAIKETKREWNECQLGYTKEFLLNREEDVAELPECCTGSTAIVAESGNVYTVGKDKAWKKREEAMEEAADAPASSGGGVLWISAIGSHDMYDEETDSWVAFDKGKVVNAFQSGKTIFLSHSGNHLDLALPHMAVGYYINDSYAAITYVDGVTIKSLVIEG